MAHDDVICDVSSVASFKNRTACLNASAGKEAVIKLPMPTAPHDLLCV